MDLISMIVYIAAPRAYHGCVCLNGLVYVIGGFDGVEHFSSVRVYNPITMEWSDASPMYCKRYQPIRIDETNK